MSNLKREKISCSICLDLLKDPVTIPCGHSYCMDCINKHWDGEDQRRIYSCLQCRKTFTPRPDLQKNFMLATLVEDLKTGLQAAPADHCYAGPEDVACDVCTGRKMKAVKSCLVCLASYCEQHFKPHNDAPPLKKHKLVGPSKTLQQNICSRHDEVMEIFCRSDFQCICYLCCMDEHKGHETVEAAAERAEKQKKMKLSRQKIKQRIQDQDQDLYLLEQEMEAFDLSADKAVKDSEKIFSDLIRLLQKRSSDVKQQIRSQQETEVNRITELQEKLEQEITELDQRNIELKQLLNTEDHNQFLHNYPYLSGVGEGLQTTRINIRPRRYFEDVTAAVAELRVKLEDILLDTWKSVSQVVSAVDVLLIEPEPKTRAEFLKISKEINLERITAYRNVVFKGNKKATVLMPKGSDQNASDVVFHTRVVSREGLTGRCYWEVEWSGGGVDLTVSYDKIHTKDSDYRHTWTFFCNRIFYSFQHKMIRIPDESCSRIGVYLDHRAGILSFYSVSETMTLLHRLQTTFTQPLYPGAYVHVASSVEFVKLKKSEPS